MAHCQLALLAIVLLGALVVAEARPSSVSSAQSLFESRKPGALKPSSHPVHYGPPAQVTRLPPKTPPSPVTISTPPSSNASVSNSSSANGTTTGNSTLQLELCMDCIDFMNNNLNLLIAIITKFGISDECDKICGQLNSTVDIDACNVMCNAIGAAAFWKMFVSAGINPIYACELVNACTAGAHPYVTFPSASITPASGPQGTNFQFKIQFTVVNETGVGEYAFVIYYPIGTDHEVGFISQQVFADYTPGDYVATLSFPTNSTFEAGKYLVLFDVCSGACGQDPAPYPYATEELTFNLTSSTGL